MFWIALDLISAQTTIDTINNSDTTSLSSIISSGYEATSYGYLTANTSLSDFVTSKEIKGKISNYKISTNNENISDNKNVSDNESKTLLLQAERTRSEETTEFMYPFTASHEIGSRYDFGGITTASLKSSKIYTNTVLNYEISSTDQASSFQTVESVSVDISNLPNFPEPKKFTSLFSNLEGLFVFIIFLAIIILLFVIVGCKLCFPKRRSEVKFASHDML
eukprot:NODE_24_length_36516_cov_0.652470.p15 type:complete len:221 gc:universal NODE_24_length_36516_cov_0.652470:32548-33210(+)